MISPLRTWQYQEPRYLWWGLGGLSVMVHIGVLGISLPYVLELMDSDGMPSPTTIPIELIVSNPTEPLAQQPTERMTLPESTSSPTVSGPTAQTAPANASEPHPTPPLADSRRTTSDSLAQMPMQPETASLPVTADPSPPLVPSSPVETTAPSDPPPTRNPDVMPSDQATSEPSVEPDLPDGSSTTVGAQPITDSIIRRAGEVDAVTSPQQPSLPAVQEQPTPRDGNEAPETEILESEEAASTPVFEDGDRALSVAFRVVGDRLAPVQDLPAEPPRLLANDSTIELQPASLGCGLINIPQSQQTYRLAIDATGSLYSVTLWADGVGQLLSESDPMDCLIRSAGLTFQPAIAKNGEPTLDDSLLLTVEIAELQAPNPSAADPP